MSIFFGADFPLREGEVRVTSNGGEDWYHVADDRDSLPKGWAHGLVAPGNNTFNRKIGVKVSGNRGAEILAIQA